MLVLVGLVVHAIESPYTLGLVCLAVSLVLGVRSDRKLGRLLNGQSGQRAGHQPVRSARGRHARRRRARR